MGAWAAGPDDLAGEDAELASVLARVPTGRLVVLGAPGAGKTMLMMRLVLDLLARRVSGAPVPFLVSAASWNPATHGLRDWLAAKLVTEHPALAALQPTDLTEETRARALMSAGLILPILDGLDEIAKEVRGSAISRINDTLWPGAPVVVTSRRTEYRDAVRPEDGTEVTLRGAAVIELRPLEAQTVARYLCDDAAGPVGRARWEPVLAALGTRTPVGEALTTPLMAGLARSIYNPRPGEFAADLRNPEELLQPALIDRASVESLLFDAFIPAAYRYRPSGRWNAQDVQRWLVFLARYLEHCIDSSDFEWWQLWKALPWKPFRFVITPMFALCMALLIALGTAEQTDLKALNVWLSGTLVLAIGPTLAFLECRVECLLKANSLKHPHVACE